MLDQLRIICLLRRGAVRLASHPAMLLAHYRPGKPISVPFSRSFEQLPICKTVSWKQRRRERFFSYKKRSELNTKRRYRAQYFAKAQSEAIEETWLDKNNPLGVSHKKGDLVAGKYKIIGVFGQGGVGVTYEAESEHGDTVAIKAMSLRNMKGWKDLDLFEREARVLKSLQHPGIPEYIDYFEVESEQDKAFYIVQKVAKGKSLAKLVEDGWRVSEEEVKKIAIEVLDVLKYLGSLRPPVIHRDIKPDNIILDEETGKVKVVDFGAVQDAASVTLIGSTVVGTYGYMAPEQFQNRATLQTDLYGLGGTLLYMLSGRSPSAFPQKRLKVDFQDTVSMSPEMARVVEKLLEPAPEDRYQSADEVVLALQGKEPAARGDFNLVDRPQTRIRQPFGTKVALRKTLNSLKITIPPAGLTAETAGTGTFAVAWNSFLVLWTGSAIAGGAPLLFTLFSLPFWFVGLRLARETLSSLTVTTDIEITEYNFSIEWKVGSYWSHRIEGSTQDISSVNIAVEGERNRQRITSCSIKEGVNTHSFGAGLQLVEKNWVVEEINSFLGLPQAPIVKETFLDTTWERERDF